MELFVTRERDIKFFFLLATLYGDFNRLTHLMRAHGKRHIISGCNFMPINSGDDVTLLNACTRSRAIGHSIYDIGTCTYRQLIVTSILGIDGLHHKADVGVRDLFALDDLVCNAQGIIGRDGKADARKRA